MIKIIAICLLAAGSALVITGVIIFVLSDCRSVLRDLSTTRKLEVDNGIDDAVVQAYYSDSYTRDENELKPARKGFIRRKDSQSRETDVLKSPAESAPKETVSQQSMGTAPLNSETQPLVQKEAAEDRRSNGNTEPLNTLMAEHSAPADTGTQPLVQDEQDEIEILQPVEPENGGGTMPLNSETQPLKGFERPKDKTKPL